MDEHVSPIDGHRHYGDAGRAECAVCCLEAERDHWRVLARREAAERDRLRAIVEAVRHFIALQVTDGHPPEDDAAAWERMIASLEQLDVSPDSGTHSEEPARDPGP
jgi:hypothetical protein